MTLKKQRLKSRFFSIRIVGVIVTYFGQTCFRVESGSMSILVDPTSNRLKGDIVLKTFFTPEDEVPAGRVVALPGEYEIQGIEIRGFFNGNGSSDHGAHTVYLVNWEEVHFAFLGGITKTLTENVIDELEEVDMLFLPIGKGYLGTDEAVSLAKKLDPKIIVPFGDEKQADFLKKIGQTAAPQEKFVFKKKELAELENKIIILSAYGA